MSLSKNLVALSFLSIVLSCEKPVIETVFEISEPFEQFVNTFYEEAALRGLDLERTNLKMAFTDEITEEYCGQCSKPKNGKQGQRLVEISSNILCWDNEPEQNKEALIFHELGHCLLDRMRHKNDLFPDGSPKSIMTETLNGPYQPCGYVIGGGNDGGDCNLTVRRSYYLDELFNENIDIIPDWVNQ